MGEVEANFLFLLNFYATFAAEGVPPMSAYQESKAGKWFSYICVFWSPVLEFWQEILTRLALTYGFFAPKTKKRQIKEIYPSIFFYQNEFAMKLIICDDTS